MISNPWIFYPAVIVISLGLAFGILMLTPWFKIRWYAIKVKRIFDRHKVQEKAEAIQQLGQNPNPVLAKKPLRDLITTYQGLIGDLEKVKAPKKAMDVHESTLAMHRESLQLYQMAAVGGFRQKAMLDRQKKLQQMERTLTEKMEKLYGPMKKK